MKNQAQYGKRAHSRSREPSKSNHIVTKSELKIKMEEPI